MHIEFPVHTVILMVGPSRCGKTGLAVNIHQMVMELGLSCWTLSSDTYRRGLLVKRDIMSFDPRMEEVSPQAFQMLMNDLDIATSYPVNAEVIIVDTRAFSEEFRKQIIDKSKSRNYNVVCINFDFRTNAEYEKFARSESEAAIIRREVSNFRKEVMPRLRKKDYDGYFRIRDIPYRWDGLSVTVSNIDHYSRCHVVNDAQRDVFVIGDTHECVDELKELIGKIETSGAVNPIIIHVGDYLDKGGNTEAMIHYIAERQGKGDIIVQANHENYVIGRLTGTISAPASIEKECFSSLEVLYQRADLSALVQDIWNKSVPACIVHAPEMHTICVTHAPCRVTEIGKLDQRSMRNQRNYRIIDREKDDVVEELRWFYAEANWKAPIHVVGHFMHAGESLNYKNQYFVDTGCVAGGRLSAVRFSKELKSPQVLSVNSTHPVTEPRITTLAAPPQKVREFNIRDYKLGDRDYEFLDRFKRTGLKYISGTMSPSASKNGVLEPIEMALEYFKHQSVSVVNIQPKYMGSRCQVYLFKDKPGFAVSRNGYIIKGVDKLDEVIESVKQTVISSIGDKWNEIILDGELLPWSILGAGLITGTFASYQELVTSELSQLRDDEFFQSMQLGAQHQTTKRTKMISEFTDTLSLYSGSGDPYYKVFDVLMVDGKDVSSLIKSASERFAAFNDDPTLTIDVNASPDVIVAKDFFASLVADGCEGVVIKPEGEVPENCVPYIKVRNEQYLKLIYGYDYQLRYQIMAEKKNVRNKMKLSLEEYKLGKKMLTATPEEMTEHVVKMIGHLERERGLDPRL